MLSLYAIPLRGGFMTKATSSRRLAGISEIELIDGSFVADRANVTRFILAERHESLRYGPDLMHHLQHTVLLRQREDAFGIVVAADVGAVESRVPVAAVDGDRVAVFVLVPEGETWQYEVKLDDTSRTAHETIDELSVIRFDDSGPFIGEVMLV
jgi:hypothetical protein